MKRFTTHFSIHNQGSQVQLKLKRIYYKGLLHPTAKTGATGFGNSVPPSLPDRRDTENRLKHTKTGATEIWIPVPPSFDRQSRQNTDG
jgi:hypothetical protein